MYSPRGEAESEEGSGKVESSRVESASDEEVRSQNEKKGFLKNELWYGRRAAKETIEEQRGLARQKGLFGYTLDFAIQTRKIAIRCDPIGGEEKEYISFRSIPFCLAPHPRENDTTRY